VASLGASLDTFRAMPHPIPEPTDAGYTTTTPVPLYWVRYRATDPTSAGSAPLVVLHGGPGADHRYLLPQMLHLAREHDLLLYDQRGGGQSRAPNNEPIGWRDHVADLASVCREFGIVTPTLVGYSWGAMLAMLYAMEAQGDAMLSAPARLALVSPAPVTAEYRQAFDANLRRRGNAPAIVAEREALIASGARERDPEGYRQRIFELGVAGYFADPAEARDLTPFRVVGRVQQSTWESLGDFDLRPGLERVRVPSIVVAGRDDPIPTASSVDAARALRAELVLLDRCGHVPYVERPQELWAALDPFLGTFPV
jgi:proline iminopeptidase